MSTPSRGLKAALLTGAVFAAPAIAHAQSATQLPAIQAAPEETGDASPSASSVAGEELRIRQSAAADSVSLLKGKPGVSLMSNGGFSTLPVLRGLADDRVLTTVDGAAITSFCPNHMNPAGSYAMAGRVVSITATPTLSSVSAGGDNIAGVIAIETAQPQFVEPGEGVKISGRVNAGYRSVADAWTSDVTATVAGEKASLTYDAAYAHAENYKRGNGDRVRSTTYENYEQAVTLGLRADRGDLLTIKVGTTFSPYEGFPTQPMDLTENGSTFVNLAYAGDFDWGALKAKANWRSYEHEMNFLSDKGGAAMGGMPMITDGTDASVQVSAEIPVEGLGTVSTGVDYFQTRLDDVWPPVAGSMMMGPGDYVNINNGERDRLGFWGELNAQPAPDWTVIAGARYERVSTDAGEVKPYGVNMMQMDDVMAAAAFNAADRKKEDDNFDATVKAQWRPSKNAEYELGLSRKTRSPNLYERYAWGRGMMSSAMTNFAGDGNSYVGDIDLKPEIATGIAGSAKFSDGDSGKRSITFSAYYNSVKDYIDADLIAPVMMSNSVFLQFSNHDAELYGFEVSGNAEVWNNERFGTGVLKASVSYTKGENTDTGDNLYHIAPLNGLVTLEQTKGRWTNAVEVEWSAKKDDVNALRIEPETGAYALANLRSSVDIGKVRVNLAVENLFDVDYDLPLGGVAYGDFMYAGGMGTFQPLPGPGRSFNVGVSMAF